MVYLILAELSSGLSNFPATLYMMNTSLNLLPMPLINVLL